MRGCMVPLCRNKGTIEGVSYHRLTSDRFVPWMIALKRNVSENVSKDSSVCSVHFLPADFIYKNGKQYLKETAVPSVNLRPGHFKTSLRSTENIFAIKECTKSNELRSTPENHFPTITKETQTVTISSNNMTLSDNTENSSDNGMKKEFSSSSLDSEGVVGSPKRCRKIIEIMHNYSQLPWKMNNLINELKVENTKLKLKLKYEKAKVNRLKTKVINIQGIVKELRKKKD